MTGISRCGQAAWVAGRMRCVPRVVRMAGSAVLCLLLAACAATEHSSSARRGATDRQTAIPSGSAPQASVIQTRDLAPGLYELVLLDGKLYVAAAGKERLNDTHGTIHVLDAKTLEPLAAWEVPLQPYSLRADAQARALYTGHTVDGGISRIDANSGKALDTFRLSKPSRRGQYLTTRKLVVDASGHRLFVAHPGQHGKVWVVDTRTNAVLHTVELERMMAFGMAYDKAADRLYVSHARGVAEIDPTRGKVLRQLALAQDQNILLNVALDDAGKRLFVADTKQGQLQVWALVETPSMESIPIGPGVLDVAFHAGLNEIYVTNRGITRDEPLLGSGQLTVVDATDYRIKRRYPLQGLPNSVIVDHESDVVYVSVKRPGNAQHPAYRADGIESVVRIDLRGQP